jgi:endoglucanase
VGLNRAGAEYGDDWNGWTGQTYYEWPSTTVRRSEFAYYASKGVNCIRLPISWERLQHTLNGSLDNAYTTNMTTYVADATSYGFTLILDLHNYGRYATGAYDSTGRQVNTYTQRVLGDGNLTFSHISDVWTKLAVLFKDNPKVIFNLMNEQHDAAGSIDSTALFAGYQSVLNSVRATGASNLVLFPNTRSSDTHHWNTWSPEGGPLDYVAANSVIDSANNMAFDMHSYQGVDAWNGDIQVVTDWARAKGKRLFLSEVGTTSGATAVSTILTHLNANSDVWIGWTTWNLDPYTIMRTDQSTGVVTDTLMMSWYAPFMTVSAPPPSQCVFMYTTWGTCQSNGTQTRTVVSYSPTGCVGTPIVSQSCVYTPPSVDSDGDGIPDSNDACPTKKGAGSSDPKQNGCPAKFTFFAKTTYDWGSGYCREFYLTNQTNVSISWRSITVNVKDGQLRGPGNFWGAKIPNYYATGYVTGTPESWNTPVGPGQTATVGLCADKGPKKAIATISTLTY